MTKFSNEQLEFLLIEIDELKKLTLAIREVGDTTPMLYALAHDKAERICQLLSKGEEKPMLKPVPEPEPSYYAIQEPPRFEEEEEEEDSPVEPHLYTQPILIETPTAPVDHPEAVVLNDKIASIATSLSDALQKRNAADLRKAFSLNDRFRFQRELFGNNAERMEAELANLDKLGSLKEAIDYVSQRMRLSLEDEVVVDFVKILERRFS